MKVLVVDDDEDIGRLIAAVLHDAGHHAERATSGSAALQAAIGNEFDLLICDLMLPDLPGTEIVRALKAQSPHLPVIVVSALDPEEWAAACTDAGAARYLQKPLSIKELRAEVALVERARLDLCIAVVDGDAIHRARVVRVLQSFGCGVHAFDDEPSFQQALGAHTGFGLVVVDAGAPGALDCIRAARDRGVAAVAFGGNGAGEEAVMRAGAALMMRKPVDADALLAQAAFMVS